MKKFIFQVWENSKLRNWAYTLAFLLIVPVGGRFSWFAWQHGNGLDRFLVIVTGLVMGALASVTLYRFWQVLPVATSPEKPVDFPPMSEEFDVLSDLDRSNVHNRLIARDAAALGWPAQRVH